MTLNAFTTHTYTLLTTQLRLIDEVCNDFHKTLPLADSLKNFYRESEDLMKTDEGKRDPIYLLLISTIVSGSRSLSVKTIAGWYHTSSLLFCMPASMLQLLFHARDVTIEPRNNRVSVVRGAPQILT